ncbi:DNA polymerase III delta [Alkalidesulfovibrio alkalitolerans DSM 16529]|uniref:DNA polymerase III delta n=1 Tax=Alkalidesulfovibrio alkalitolerans DSM 16529 TaxID=1121439 RepID=S7T8T7_9BACT|nr:DNA polymerase III delta [Alkalidesulfovibrio alkalitolerans]EPR33011.1 DNA polymerase III delta [Alkalidesulfovibrio alkalitolerans DSM 16529]
MTRPGFSFLACPDSELIRRRIRSMLDGQGLERRVYWGDEDLPPKFWQDMSSQGLFGGCKAVVVRHAQALPEKTLAQLSPLLAGMNESAWPIFCVEVPFEKGGPKIPAALKKQKYWIFAEKKGWVWTSPGLTEKTLPDYLRAWSKDTGIAVPQPVLRDLAAMLPPDAAAVDSELAKLELALAGRRELRAEDLDLVASESSIDFFSLLDALLRGRLETRVLREVLRERSSSDGLLFKLLANMARDARLMWMILSGENTGLPGWMTQKKEPLARAAGPARVAALFGLLMEAEHGVKSGERTEAQALENLVAELSRLFAPARRGA